MCSPILQGELNLYTFFKNLLEQFEQFNARGVNEKYLPVPVLPVLTGSDEYLKFKYSTPEGRGVITLDDSAVLMSEIPQVPVFDAGSATVPIDFMYFTYKGAYINKPIVLNCKCIVLEGAYQNIENKEHSGYSGYTEALWNLALQDVNSTELLFIRAYLDLLQNSKLNNLHSSSLMVHVHNIAQVYNDKITQIKSV